MSEQAPEVKENNVQSLPTIGFGIAALVLGIFSFILFKYIFISVTLALVSCILGCMGLKKGDRTFAVAGLSIGIISLLITFILFVVLNLLDTVLFYVPEWYN